MDARGNSRMFHSPARARVIWSSLADDDALTVHRLLSGLEAHGRRPAHQVRTVQTEQAQLQHRGGEAQIVFAEKQPRELGRVRARKDRTWNTVEALCPPPARYRRCQKSGEGRVIDRAKPPTRLRALLQRAAQEVDVERHVK